VPQQKASAARVRYEMPEGIVLADIHSHHQMPPFFSNTDDRDDTGLSVSCVIGHIYDAPQILCRVNVWGHRQVVPALTIFDDLGPFCDAYNGGAYVGA
jgi:PRTRC genetic system protein A